MSTSSSESALPRLIAKMEHAGVDKATVGVVVPTGYSFNLDGTAIYLTMASLFIAEALGDPLSIGEQISLLLFMMIASKGAAGVTGAGLATLAGGLRSHRPELRRRRRPDRRHRPVHVRGARGDQLRRQRGRHGADRRTGPTASTAGSSTGCSPATTRSTRPRCSTPRRARARRGALQNEERAPETTRSSRCDDDPGGRPRGTVCRPGSPGAELADRRGGVHQVQAEAGDRGAPVRACSAGLLPQVLPGQGRVAGEEQELQRVGAPYDVLRDRAPSARMPSTYAATQAASSSGRSAEDRLPSWTSPTRSREQVEPIGSAPQKP